MTLQSPPWTTDPLWSKRLYKDVEYLTRHCTRPPEGVDWEDFLQEVRVCLIRRSMSPKSRWDPNRGKTWSAWVCMVARSFSINYHKKQKIRQAWEAHAKGLEEAVGLEGGLLAPLRADAVAPLSDEDREKLEALAVKKAEAQVRRTAAIRATFQRRAEATRIAQELAPPHGVGPEGAKSEAARARGLLIAAGHARRKAEREAQGLPYFDGPRRSPVTTSPASVTNSAPEGA